MIHASEKNVWRLVALGLATMLLCSCRTLTPGQTSKLNLPQQPAVMQAKAQSPAPDRAPVRDRASLAPEVIPSIPRDYSPECNVGVAGMAQCNTGCCPTGCAAPGAPLAQSDCPPLPFGKTCPWPADEYLCDGGDEEIRANIGPERRIQGLELEDTVVAFDTIDGRTLIEPSNKVCLYAPRFGATRKVTSVVENLQNEQAVGAKLPVMPHLNREDQLARNAVQPVQPEGEIGIKHTRTERVGEAIMPAISRQPIAALDHGFAVHENYFAIRTGRYDEAEKPRLMESIDAAINWTHDAAVQVILEGRKPSEIVGNQKAQATYFFDTPNHPALRVIKVASTKVAQPGDIVDFTIRFDNQGDTELRNLVLVDNLTTRLEYVPDSAQSSRDAEFFTDDNEGESLTLRWVFSEPLPVGGGGLVRFHCRVR